MKFFDWSEKKNEWLRRERGMSFERVVVAIENNQLLDVLEHHNQKRYAGQRIFVVDMDDYVFLVPFLEKEDRIFIKTIIPSRKAVSKYGQRRKNVKDG